MTKELIERYYYFDSTSRTVFHTIDNEDIGFLEFLGSSKNPNIKMAVSAFAQKLPWNSGYNIKLLP